MVCINAHWVPAWAKNTATVVFTLFIARALLWGWSHTTRRDDY